VAAWRAIRSMAVMAFVVGAPGYVQASEGSGVGVVTTLVGEATVVRTAAAQPRNLRMRDNVLPLDRITTKERSLVHVLMGGKALLTVKELSVVTVTEDGGRATVDLQSGKVGLAVVHEKMKPGDVIEVKTPHAVAAVRGTVLVVEIVPGTGEANQPSRGEDVTNVHLIHGKLDVSLRNNPGGTPVRLESLQTVSVTRDVLGKMRPLDLPTATTLATGLKPADQVVTAIPAQLQAAVDQRQGALALATAGEVARNGLRSQTVNGRDGKVGATATAKVTDSVSGKDAIVTLSEVSDGAATFVGSFVGSLDAVVGSLDGAATSGTGSGGGSSVSSGSGALGGVVGAVGSLDAVVGSLGGTSTSVSGGGSGSGSGGGSSLSTGSGGGGLGGVVGAVLGGGGGSSSGSGSSGGGGGSVLGSSGPVSSGSGGGGKGPSLGSGSGPGGTLLSPVLNLPLFKKK
jgi:FecR protein